MFGRRLPRFAIFAIAFAPVAGCSNCKKQAENTADKATKTVEKKVQELTEAPAPADLAAEVIAKDVDGVAKETLDGMGVSLSGADPWDKIVAVVPDPSAKLAMRALDPHSGLAIAFAWSGDVKDKPKVAAAMKLKDVELAESGLSTAAKMSGGKMTSWNSKVLDADVYEVASGKDHFEIATVAGYAVLGVERESVEGLGKYVAWKASKAGAQGHDLVARIVFEKLGPALQKLGNDGWAKAPMTSVPPALKAALDPLVPALLQGLADVGEWSSQLDVEGKVLKFQSKLAGKGTFADYLQKYPQGGAGSLLTLPRGEGASMFQFPPGLGNLGTAALDAVAGILPLSPGDRTVVATQLASAIGGLSYEVSMTSAHPSASETETFVHVACTDGKAVHDAFEKLEKMALDANAASNKGNPFPPPEPKLTAYKKFGAEGESLFLPTSGGPIPDLTFSWAVRANDLYVDLAVGKQTLWDDGLDPASKKTFADDAAAKTKISSYPTKGLVGASYLDSWTLSSLIPLPGMASTPIAGTAPAGSPGWSYSSVGTDGLTSQGELPLNLVADLAKFYGAIFSKLGGKVLSGGGGTVPSPSIKPAPSSSK